MKQTVEEAAREAIHKHYNCNGTYPCSEREYCEHCNGHNTAFDCCECGADEFKEGFIAGANWHINSVWHKTKDEVVLCEVVYSDKIGSFVLLEVLSQNLGNKPIGQMIDMFGIRYVGNIYDSPELLK